MAERLHADAGQHHANGQYDGTELELTKDVAAYEQEAAQTNGRILPDPAAAAGCVRHPYGFNHGLESYHCRFDPRYSRW